jgi:NHLM bacteriocin system ABC transporter ATP-binding protein
MADDPLALFTREGTPFAISGNTPVLLDDPQAVWLVGSGGVLVFATSLQNGRPAGVRTQLCRARAGQILLGADVEPAPGVMGLLAVGMAQGQLLKLPLQRFHEQLRQGSAAEALAELLDEWVRRLTRGVVRGFPARDSGVLEPCQDLKLNAGDQVSTRKRVLWVQHAAGSSLYLGKEHLYVSKRDGYFPLAEPAWLQVPDSAQLKVLPTQALLGELDLWPALRGFLRMVLTCVAVNAQEADAQERARAQRKSAAFSRLMQGTLARLAAVVVGAPADIVPEAEEPLLHACRLVGERLGVAIKEPPGARLSSLRHVPSKGTASMSSFLLSLGAQKKLKPSDALRDIARASQVRVRRVALKGEWWRTDNGPLIAFREADEAPVALLPLSPTRYELADPQVSGRVEVTTEGAASLSGLAYSFYRPLPGRALRAWDLIRFGLHGCSKDATWILLLAVASGALALVTPLATGFLFDTAIPSARTGDIWLIALVLLVTATTTVAFQLSRSLVILRVMGKTDAAIEAGIWDRLLRLPVPFFRQYAAGELAMRAAMISGVRQILTGVVISSLLTGVFSIFNLVVMFLYDAKLAALACLPIVALVSITGLGVFYQSRYERDTYSRWVRIGGIVLQLVTGLSRLRVAAAEDRALAHWAKEFGVQKRLSTQAHAIANNLATFHSTVPVLSSLIVFACFAAWGAPEISLGAFLGFYAAFGQLVAAALALGTTFTSLARIIPLYQMTRPILQALPEVDEAKADPGELSGAIEVSHVSFGYSADGPPILDDFSVQINPGEFAAFVGPSGSGKSTLVRLLLGFETPRSGSLYYDRQDLAGLDLQAVRRQLGVVLQHSRLVSGDLLTNIIGSAPLTVDDAWEAARLSGLEEDIKQMPMGMYTLVNEGGSTLSGGQRQRVLIARSIVARPKIIVFDEATSALDNQTQAVVSQSLERLKATRLVVAHRLSTIRNADTIYVMEKGKIIQRGTYDELMQQPGLFADLATRQLA